jgi:probable HAF family extracellular repeat protein
MSRIIRTTLVLFAIAFSNLSHGATFFPLGVELPGDVPFGVSPNGDYVVTGRRVWTAASGFTNISPVGEIYARDIANNGLVAGLWCGNNTGSCYEGFRSPAGGPVQGIGAFDNWASDAFAITPDGQTLAGIASSADGTRSVRWTSAGGLVSLGTLGPGAGGQDQARGISADGSVVVGTSGEDNDVQAYRWTEATGMVGIGDLDGGAFSSRAGDVSGNGPVIIGTGTSSLGMEAFRWTAAAGMVPLGDLSGGGFSSEAMATTFDGKLVVGESQTAAGRTAFIWTEVGGMQDLRSLLATQYGLGAALASWQLTSATDISADGKVIVGYGENPSGQTEGFVIKIPEPAGAGLSVCAAAFALHRRRSSICAFRRYSSRDLATCHSVRTLGKFS